VIGPTIEVAFWRDNVKGRPYAENANSVDNYGPAYVRRASRARWGDLLTAGAEIHEYQPTMYHCKVLIVDQPDDVGLLDQISTPTPFASTTKPI